MPVFFARLQLIFVFVLTIYLFYQIVICWQVVPFIGSSLVARMSPAPRIAFFSCEKHGTNTEKTKIPKRSKRLLISSGPASHGRLAKHSTPETTQSNNIQRT